MKFEPTQEQRLAVELTEENIVLSAGAGSGKTRVLVERYLSILKKKLANVDQILAITFTNKATGEMRERILKEVFKLAEEAKSLEEEDFWRKVKDDLSTAQITTFHSFCGQILRSNPIKAGVDPFFQILDEDQADELLEEVLEEMLLDALRKKNKDLITLITEYGLYGIKDLLKGAYLNSRESNLTLDELVQISNEELTLSFKKLEDLKLEIQNLVIEMFEINENKSLAQGTRTKLDRLKGVWKELSVKIKSIQSLEDFERWGLVELRDVLKGNVAKEIKEQNARLKEILEEEFNSVLADIKGSYLIPAVINILQLLDTEYKEKKKRLNSFDFSDLEKFALKILKNHPEICSYYQQKYRFIMVDEFQDTNPLQEELIRLIITGSSDGKIIGNKLFIVGDPKQSIYRFRGADVTVFKKLQTEIKNNGQEIIMNLNFRSREKIIEFINHVFYNIFGDKENDYDMEYLKSQAFRQIKDTDECIEFLLLDYDQLKEENLNPRDEEASRLALRIREMILNEEKLVFEKGPDGAEIARPVRYGDICILFQALSNIQQYEEALRRYNIPYVVINGRGFYSRQEIRDVVNLLKIIENPGLTISWAGVLRSPFCGLSDEELFKLFTQNKCIYEIIDNPEKIHGLTELSVKSLNRFLEIYAEARKNRDKKELSLLISELINKTGYMQVSLAHPQKDLIRANLEKFISVAREYEKNYYSSLRGFINYVERMDEKVSREGQALITGNNDTIKLMTVHQAKGLEFPVVIIPDTQRPLINPMNFPPIFFDAKLGIGLKVKDPLLGGYINTSLYKMIYEEEKKREVAERKRVFYVAATRARDYLLISGTLKPFKQKQIFESNNWLEWLGNIFAFTCTTELPSFLNYGAEDKYKIKVTLCQELKLPEEKILENRIDLKELLEIDKNATFKSILEKDDKEDLYSLRVDAFLKHIRCPKWFYFSEVLKLPENINLFNQENNEINLDADSRDFLIHYICQHLKNEEDYEILLKRGVSLLKNSPILTDQLSVKLVEELKPPVEAFLRGEELMQVIMEGEDYKDERGLPFNLTIDNIIVKGTIDRVLKKGEKILIVRYKTEMGVYEIPEDYKLEAELYSLALHKLSGFENIKFLFYYLYSQNHYKIEFTRKDFLRIEDELNKILKEHHTLFGSKKIPITPGKDQCLYKISCPYINLCERSKKIIFKQELSI